MSSRLSSVELLKLGDGDRQPTVLTKYWPYILGSVLGFSSGMLINFGTMRPLYSGLQKHFALMGGMSGLLYFVQQKRNAYYAEKDAVLRHYIELHPEDFIICPPPKVGEVIEPWIPIR